MKYYLLIATAFIFIISCNKDDGGPTEPTNLAPLAPSSPSPRDRTINRPIDVDLSWSCSDPDGDPLTYDVYFGTSIEPPLVSEDQTETTFDPDELNYRQKYYWQVIAKDDHEYTSVGEVWSFRIVQDLSNGDNPGEERRFFLLSSSIDITMVWIPADTFMMGAQGGESDAEENEYPRHEVRIETGFWMGKYEVIQAQWEEVTHENPSRFQGDNRPVETVSWNDIQSFLEQVNDGYRLPSEAEWEYACRAGMTTRFYWGDDQDYEEIADYAWYEDNSDDETHVVGQKSPNDWGLYDMSGNVTEWCEDDYHSSYNNAPDDGSAWINDPRDDYRALRGGTWHFNPTQCRSAVRHYHRPNNLHHGNGFRLVFVH